MKKFLLSAMSTSFLLFQAMAQNVSVNNTGATADPSAMLDVIASNKGILIPRLSLVATNSSTPITSPANSLLVYNTNTASSGSTTVSPGFYYWNSTEWTRILNANEGWQLNGNSPAQSGKFGTISNQSIDMISNNTVRGRISNLGKFTWGNTATATGELMGAISNSTNPIALAGYSSFNGPGVLGSITGGNTTFAGVQGEYSSTGAGVNTAGVRGINQSTVAGNGYRTQPQIPSGPRVGVIGATSVSSGLYTFGLHGSMGSTDARCGGIFADDFGIAQATLAYYASNLVDYSVYGFGKAFEIGAPGGRQPFEKLDQPNTNIGLGIYGGVMGGWIRGMVYGAHTKGERYGLYVDGKSYVNAPITELINTGAKNRLPVYTMTSLAPEIYLKGKATIQNGEARIDFDSTILKLISEKPEDLVVTVTPTCKSKGLFIAQQDARGFMVSENEKSGNPISFNWMVIATRRDAQANQQHSPELLQSNFDQLMNGVMFNENNHIDKSQPIWWDGNQIRFDLPPAKQPDQLVGSFSSTVQPKNKSK